MYQINNYGDEILGAEAAYINTATKGVPLGAAFTQNAKKPAPSRDLSNYKVPCGCLSVLDAGYIHLQL